MPSLSSTGMGNDVSQMIGHLIFKDCQAVLILAGATDDFISDTWQSLHGPVSNIVSTIIKITYVTTDPRRR